MLFLSAGVFQVSLQFCWQNVNRLSLCGNSSMRCIHIVMHWYRFSVSYYRSVRFLVSVVLCLLSLRESHNYGQILDSHTHTHTHPETTHFWEWKDSKIFAFYSPGRQGNSPILHLRVRATGTHFYDPSELTFVTISVSVVFFSVVVACVCNCKLWPIFSELFCFLFS